MTSFSRAIAIVAALGVAGLSSPLAICVAACSDRSASEPAAHECHDAATPRASLTADTGACSHAPTIVDGVELARDAHSPVVAAGAFKATITAPASRNLTMLAHADRRAPALPVTSPPILRI